MFAGVGSGMLLCTAGVAKGTLTVGDTVLFLTLMAQLYGERGWRERRGGVGEGGFVRAMTKR